MYPKQWTKNIIYNQKIVFGNNILPNKKILTCTSNNEGQMDRHKMSKLLLSNLKLDLYAT